MNSNIESMETLNGKGGVQRPESLSDQVLGRVLVIDDNPIDIELVKATLERAFFIEAAGDGEAGYHKAVSFLPDCIISDVRMPEMSGFTLLRKIRTNPDLEEVPVILLTALDEPRDKVQGYDLTADLYLTKPVDTDELFAAVKSLTRLHKKRKSPGVDESPASLSISIEDQEFLKRLIFAINDNISNPDFKVEDLAKAIYASRRQLERRVKQLENITPAQYIRQVRLEEAKKLITAGAYSNLQELAQRVGLRDARHFSKIFKSQYGFSPVLKS